MHHNRFGQIPPIEKWARMERAVGDMGIVAETFTINFDFDGNYLTFEILNGLTIIEETAGAQTGAMSNDLNVMKSQKIMMESLLKGDGIKRVSTTICVAVIVNATVAVRSVLFDFTNDLTQHFTSIWYASVALDKNIFNTNR